MLLRMFFTVILTVILILTLNSVFSPYVVILIAFIVTFIVLYLPLVYTAYFTKNVGKVDKFFEKNKHQPIYRLYYGLAHHHDEDISEAMKMIKKKYQRPHQLAIFRVIYQFHYKDMDDIEKLIEQIQPEPYRQYYEVAYLVEVGELEEAESKLKLLKRGWMREVILTELELRKGNQEAAFEHYQKALDGTGGLQRYSIYHTYRNKFITA